MQNVKVNKVGGKLLQPKQVIEQFYKSYNQKNLKGIYSVTTKRYHSADSNLMFNNLKSIKAIKITLETDPKYKQGYMHYGLGKTDGLIDIAKEKELEKNIIIYKVSYEVKYIKDSNSIQKSGEHTFWIYLIRKDINSPWLINDMGV